MTYSLLQPMKILFLTITASLLMALGAKAQSIEDPVSHIDWKRVVLANEAEFTAGQLNWGSGFLIRHQNDTIACTARDFTGTTYTRGEMLLIKDFAREMKFWKMYIPDQPSQFVELDTLVMPERIERKVSILMFSANYLTFSLKHKNPGIIPLEPDTRKIPNRDTVFIVGYDHDHNLRIVEGIVEMVANEKFADLEIRIRTEVYLGDPGFAGAPIVDRQGKAIGLTNRSYYLYKNKKGRIISDKKPVEGGYHEFFINGTTMRSVLGKDDK